MFIRLKNCQSFGFTLIELLVSIAIFGLLSSFVVASYRGNEKALQLKIEVQNIVSAIETAQNLALSGEMTGDALPLSYEFDINDCVSSCSYETFAVISDGKKSVAKGNISASIVIYPAGGLVLDFLLPRGKMIILNNNNIQDISKIQISNDSGAYCITLNSISGRISMVSGQCGNL